LDAARYCAFLAAEIGCSVEDVHALLLGGHGDDMVPLTRYSFAGGIPVSQLVSSQRLEEIVKRTRNGGAEIVSLLKTGSAYYAPASATVAMAESIIRDKKRILACAAYCDREYGVGGYFVGVPCVLGTEGVEKIIEIDLDDSERKMFNSSVQHVKELVKTVKI
jgi:malate dehydrogenase